MASVCNARTPPSGLKPPSTTAIVSPAHSATAAASMIRVALGTSVPYLIARAMTTRWISFVPS
jgi:hypothetical protein